MYQNWKEKASNENQNRTRRCGSVSLSVLSATILAVTLYALNVLKRLLYNVGAKGFEPSTPCSQSRCASRTAPYPEKKDDSTSSFLTAEKGGFEPPVPLAEYDSLANCWFQPLTHLSVVRIAGAKIRLLPVSATFFLIFFEILEQQADYQPSSSSSKRANWFSVTYNSGGISYS